MSRRLAAVAATALGLLLVAAPVAPADTGDIIEPQHTPSNRFDGWQAGPCVADSPASRCAPDTPGLFFKTAGGHPPVGFVQFAVKHTVVEENKIEPLLEPIRSRVPRTIRVDLPPGLSVNPEATPEKCSFAEFAHEPVRGSVQPQCKPGTVVGESLVNIVNEGEHWGVDFGPIGTLILPGVDNFSKVKLFNLQPSPGEPALFGFVAATQVRVLLRTEIAWETDFHESFSIRGLPEFESLKFGGFTAPVAILSDRLATFGNAGDGTLATNPTTCFDADQPQFRHIYSSWIRMDSFVLPDIEFPFGSTAVESPLPPGVHPEGCENIPFDPSIELNPGTALADSPASPTVTTRLPAEVPGRGGGPIAESHLRSATVTLPAGMGLNPAGSNGLLACTDAQFHQGDRSSENQCPPGSILGTAEIRSPVLAQALQGNVYLGEPRSADPASGEEFRVFVEAKATQRGVVVRLVGNVKADPRTGQLTAVFDDRRTGPFAGILPHGLPQVPFESLTLRFDGTHKILTTPPTCAPSTTTSAIEPWARPGDHVSPLTRFTLSSVPGGGACPQTLAQRAFAPAFTARADSRRGGAFTPFRVHIGRPEGQQEVKRLDLALPRGVIGRLAGIPYCSEEALAAAAGKSGAAERGAPSCSPASQVGTASTEAGTGANPLRLTGGVYLSGPYRGAPLSLAVITPATSGPFDLGNVVIRAALELDPVTAQISASSDVFPDVFGGVKLDLRTIDIDLGRPRFMLNPTSCAAQATTGAIAGGGADPTNPAAFNAQPVGVPFQATGCDGLEFEPKLITTVSGPVKRSKFPRLSATLLAREGDANISSLALRLPHAFFVAQEHFSTVCTRPQLAAGACPPNSVYGEAEARTPLLDGKLRGPVYLVPGGNSLPDMVVDLHGQVDIRLRGTVTSRKGGIEAAFDSVPDVPVSEFALRMEGGKKSLIVNSANICKSGRFGSLSISGHNGRQLTNKKYKLNLASCKKPKRKHRSKHKHGRKQHRRNAA